MGAIEDIRKVMQDFLAPELHSIREKLQTLETGQHELRAEMLRLFDKAEQDNKTRFQELVQMLNLDARVKRIEEREFTSEQRVSGLEGLLRDYFSQSPEKLRPVKPAESDPK